MLTKTTLPIITTIAIVASAAHAQPAREPGLLVRLYDIDGDMRFLPELAPNQLPNVVKVVPTLELRTDRGDFEPLTDHILTEVTGYLTIKHADKYMFRLLSDDGARLWIDDRLVIDNDGLHGPDPKDGEFAFTAGEHSLRVLHFENLGGEHLELQWRLSDPGAESEFHLIPASYLSHAADESRKTAPGKKRIIPPLRRSRPGDGTPVIAPHPTFRALDAVVDYQLPKKSDWVRDGRLRVMGQRRSEAREPLLAWLPADAAYRWTVKLSASEFRGQRIAEATSGESKRVFLDQVDAASQGCVFRLGPLKWPFLPAGPKTFEMLGVRAMTNGFEIEFTKPLDPRCGWDPESYYIEQWPFRIASDEATERRSDEGNVAAGAPAGRSPQESTAQRAVAHGSEPKAQARATKPGGTAVSAVESREDTAHRAVAHRSEPGALATGHPPTRDGVRYPVKSASVSPDRKKVFLEIENLKESHVVYIRLLPPCISEDGELPWSTEAWYTLNAIPQNRYGKVLTPPPVEPQNFLTEQEQAAGWKLLFDGKTTKGWRGYKKDTFPHEGWQAINGCLVRVGRGGDICTEDEFDNFELKLEWRISAGGNSGIFFRVSEACGWPWESSPEMQVLDNAEHADGRNPKTSAGSNYALHAPVGDVTEPIGLFNKVRIVADGPQVEYWLNGVKIVEYELGSPEWEQLVANSKFKKMPHHGRVKSGRIVLQDHGDKVWYRNIKIRELPEE